MSNQANATMMILNHDTIRASVPDSVLEDLEKRGGQASIPWSSFCSSSLSGGLRVALAWAYRIWSDENPPAELGLRDPILDFGVLDEPIQETIIQAFAVRHGFTHVYVKREQSDFEKAIRSFTKG